jgi:hypothetical protein
VDGQTVKLCRTDIIMETGNRKLLEKIATQLDPNQYELENGDIQNQYIPEYYMLSKVLMATSDPAGGLFDEERFHWIVSADPFFHLVAGPESIQQRELMDFAMELLKEKGGEYMDLPQLMARTPEEMEAYRKNIDFYIDIQTAGIIRDHFLRLDDLHRGLFYHLWADTHWNVWIPLLWLNELCTDEHFATGIMATTAMTPAFSDVSDKDFKETMDHYLKLLEGVKKFEELYHE